MLFRSFKINYGEEYKFYGTDEAEKLGRFVNVKWVKSITPIDTSIESLSAESRSAHHQDEPKVHGQSPAHHQDEELPKLDEFLESLAKSINNAIFDEYCDRDELRPNLDESDDHQGALISDDDEMDEQDDDLLEAIYEINN